MITLKETILVNRAVAEAFRYTSDFTFISEWDPSVVHCRKTSPGKVGLGTEFELTLRYWGLPVTMVYQITAFEPPHRVVLEGRGGTFTAVDTIDFKAHANQTRIDYRADITFQGRPIIPAMALKGILRRMGRKAISGLDRALNDAGPPPNLNTVTTWLDKSIIGGLPAFTKWGFEHAKRRWNPLAVSLEGKTALITGATSGIGRAAAFRLAHMGARVLMVARDYQKAENVRKEIASATGNDQIAIYQADLGRIGQVNALVKALGVGEARLDILINNAGALYNERRTTEDGLENTFATNLLAPFVLTEGLIPKLSACAPARIVNVSSGGMYTQKIQVNDLQFANEPFDGSKAYARAKRGLLILSELWAEQLQRLGISVHCMHPGWVRTPGIRRALPGFYQHMDRWLRVPEQGADTIVWLAAAPEAARRTGLFWLDRRPHVTHVFRHTRETSAERTALRLALEQYHKEL